LNYQRGDGLERAICLANILKNRNPGLSMEINVEKDHVYIITGGKTVTWPSAKGLKGNIRLNNKSF